MEWSFFGGLSDWEPQIDSITCKCKSVFCLLFSYYLWNNFLRGLLGRGPQVGLFASEGVSVCFLFVKWFFWQFILPSVNCGMTSFLKWRPDWEPHVFMTVLFSILWHDAGLWRVAWLFDLTSLWRLITGSAIGFIGGWRSCFPLPGTMLYDHFFVRK